MRADVESSVKGRGGVLFAVRIPSSCLCSGAAWRHGQSWALPHTIARPDPKLRGRRMGTKAYSNVGSSPDCSKMDVRSTNSSGSSP